MRNDLDLAIGSLRDNDLIAEVTNTALDLDAVMQELLEGGDVEDLIARGLRSVDDELAQVSLRDSVNSSGAGLPSS